MAEINDLGISKIIQKLDKCKNFLNLLLLDNLSCTLYVKCIFISFILAYITCPCSVSCKIKADSYETKILKVNFLFSTESKI